MRYRSSAAHRERRLPDSVLGPSALTRPHRRPRQPASTGEGPVALRSHAATNITATGALLNVPRNASISDATVLYLRLPK
jgi:hypothetical protein